MAAAESDSLFQPFESSVRLFTAADLEALPSELPSGPIDYELDDGRLVFITVPPGEIHGVAQLNIAAHLKLQGEFEPVIHGETDTLELPGLIPGFALPVADVFLE